MKPASFSFSVSLSVTPLDHARTLDVVAVGERFLIAQLRAGLRIPVQIEVQHTCLMVRIVLGNDTHDVAKRVQASHLGTEALRRVGKAGDIERSPVKLLVSGHLVQVIQNQAHIP